MERKTFLIKEGYFLYNNIQKIRITIVKQNWDFYFEEGYSDENPHLNDEGFAYYVIFNFENDFEYLSRSSTFYSEKEAVNYIEKNYEVIWSWDLG